MNPNTPQDQPFNPFPSPEPTPTPTPAGATPAPTPEAPAAMQQPVAPASQPEQPTPAQNPSSNDGGAAQQPSSPTLGGSNKKKIALIAGIAAAVLLIGGGIVAFALSSQNGESPLDSVADTVTGQNADVVDRPDGTLNLNSKVDGNESIVAQDLSATVGQQINLSDGLSFMVNSVEVLESYQRTSLGEPTTIRPASGNEFVQVEYVVGNRTEDDTVRYASSTFDVTNTTTEDDYSDIRFLSTDPLAPENYYSLDFEALNSGEQQKFIVYYEVPAGAPLSATVERQYRNFTTDETITVRGVISLR